MNARKSDKLTEIVKTIFGRDVVECAYILVTDWKNSEKSKAELDRIERSLPVFLKQELHDDDFYFDWSSIEMAIEMKNGNIVRMGNSEWAHMSVHENISEATNDY